MKYIIIPCLLLSMVSFSQDCKLKKETDPFTHITRLTTGFVPFVSKTGVHFSLSVDATSSDIDFFFLFPGESKCFDEASTAVVNYEGDRLKANFKNAGSMNCEGAFHFNFRNLTVAPSALERLSQKRINSIKITGSNNTVTEVTLDDEYKKLFLNIVACIIKESKSLIRQ